MRSHSTRTSPPRGDSAGGSSGARYPVPRVLWELTHRQRRPQGSRGLALGSDVPFFMAGPSLCTGNGKGRTGDALHRAGPPCGSGKLHGGDTHPVAYRLWDETHGHLTGAGPVNHYTAQILEFGMRVSLSLSNSATTSCRCFQGDTGEVAETAADAAGSQITGVSADRSRFYTPFSPMKRRQWRRRIKSSREVPVGIPMPVKADWGVVKWIEHRGFGPCIGGSSPPAPAAFP